MKKIILLMLTCFFVVTLCSCGSTSKAATDTPKESEEINETVEEATEEAQYCFVCGRREYEGGYNLNVAGEYEHFCKDCRDELMINNGFVVVKGKKIRPFENETLYRDDLVVLPVYEDYNITELEKDFDNGFWKGEFVNKYNSDIMLLLGWSDFCSELDLENTAENRKMFSFSSLDFDDEDVIQTYQDVLGVEDRDSMLIEEIQGNTWIFVVDSSDMVYVYTIKDGVAYKILYVYWGDEELDEDDNFYWMDALIEAANFIFPSRDDVVNYFS